MMIKGPYYIVKEGTNRRRPMGEKQIPEIYDTEELAKREIDDVNAQMKSTDELLKRKAPMRWTFVPISVAEYNRKYAKIMGIKED